VQSIPNPATNSSVPKNYFTDNQSQNSNNALSQISQNDYMSSPMVNRLQNQNYASAFSASASRFEPKVSIVDDKGDLDEIKCL